jgi:3-methyladenine DNA glycosylase AlkD
MDIVKYHLREEGIPSGKDLQVFIKACYEESYREMHYAACEITQRALKKEPPPFIKMLEWMITRHSWWDTVDWLAKLAGMHLQRYQELQPHTTDRWIASPNMWLQRTAVIHQRFYRQATDAEMLGRYIAQVYDTKEFFIQKACGWALREYSKVNPSWVKKFVKAHPELKPLSRKEALRLLEG